MKDKIKELIINHERQLTRNTTRLEYLQTLKLSEAGHSELGYLKGKIAVREDIIYDLEELLNTLL